MPLYFAYGSNMDVAAMSKRCPRSLPLGIARLARHRIGKTRRGFATVARDPRDAVWGLLWDLAFADVPALDRWEEVAKGLYTKQTQPVIRDGGAAVQALIYIGASDEPPGPPASPAYGAAVVEAARAACVPPAYGASLASVFQQPVSSLRRRP